MEQSVSIVSVDHIDMTAELQEARHLLARIDHRPSCCQFVVYEVFPTRHVLNVVFVCKAWFKTEIAMQIVTGGLCTRVDIIVHLGCLTTIAHQTSHLLGTLIPLKHIVFIAHDSIIERGGGQSIQL